LTAAYIARRLPKGRKSGAGFIACCPAHKDGNPSLSLRDANGRVLVHCFAGCDQRRVIDALRDRELWPERERREHTPAERRAWAIGQRIRGESAYFVRASRALASMTLETAEHPHRIALSELVRDLRACPISTYVDWRDHHPEFTAALVQAGRQRDGRLQRRLAHFLTAEAHAA